MDNYAAFQWGVRDWKYIGGVTPEKSTQTEDVVLKTDRPTTQSANAAYELVLAQAGASKIRDAADKRVIAGVISRRNRRIDSQKQVERWPNLESGSAPQDTHGDAMPDHWEPSRAAQPQRSHRWQRLWTRWIHQP